jgi:hypothetical protein
MRWRMKAAIVMTAATHPTETMTERPETSARAPRAEGRRR